MDNLRAVIVNLFCNISPEEILQGNAKYDNLSEKTFMKLGSGYITKYSVDELRNMYSYLETEFLWHRLKMQDKLLPAEKTSEVCFNVFDVLALFGDAVLTEEDEEPKCLYTQLLRWRESIMELEEDLFITSSLAYKDSMRARVRENFFWKPVIGHNNRELNTILSQGVAENHFHLKGSAPHFHLSWISMMNHVDNKNFQKLFESYESNRLHSNLAYDVRYGIRDLAHMWRQAALIRLFLFSILQDTYLKLPKYILSIREFMTLCTCKEKERIREIYSNRCSDFLDLKKRISLNEVQDKLSQRAKEKGEAEKEGELEYGTWFAVKQYCSRKWVSELLKKEEELKDYVGIIQENIVYLQEEYGEINADYTLCRRFLKNNPNKHLNEILSGERWLMYTIFRRAYMHREITDAKMKPYFNLFYMYLVLKANIRKELVQANTNVGFSNFQLYQERKDVFIDNTPYEKMYVRMAVRDTIYNQHIMKLEARIAPRKTALDNLKAVQKYDSFILEGLERKEREHLKEKYFYVVHFIKEEEHWSWQSDSGIKDECRHYKKRKEVEEQALALAEFREKSTSEAARIRGIDAAASELWCRPEVFGQAFRFLKKHQISDEGRRYQEAEGRQLLASYHAGEDFLDVVDGLRAIDEAILFLNLHCGDRLGHALALGVDIYDWYESKTNQIIINKIGYLDNLVWLYEKIREYRIEGCEKVISYIEKRFDEYFREIYYNNITGEEITYICKKAQKYFEAYNLSHSYQHYNLMFNINVYYDAWKLRGDNPQYYREGFFKPYGNMLSEWDMYAVNKEYPRNYRIRYNPETALLYYMYHYNYRVKVIGDQMIEVKVLPFMKEAVKKVAKAMQFNICNRGICIETNPSSNYLIGTFRRYDKHPIIRWYNHGLTKDLEELENCPQISVSINTDDQGIFATSIENEYAYLALALEKAMEPNGNKRYNRTMIFQWLDHIRRMGLEQSFDVNNI